MNKKQKKIGIVLGIVALVIVVMYFGEFRFPLSIGFSFFDESNLRIQSIDSQSVNFQVKGIYTGQYGSFAIRPSVEKQNELGELSMTFGSSDYPCTYSDCRDSGLQSKKYPIINAQLTGFKGKVGYNTGNETEFSGTIITVNTTGYCSIPEGFVSFTKTSLSPQEILNLDTYFVRFSIIFM